VLYSTCGVCLLCMVSGFIYIVRFLGVVLFVLNECCCLLCVLCLWCGVFPLRVFCFFPVGIVSHVCVCV